METKDILIVILLIVIIGMGVGFYMATLPAPPPAPPTPTVPNFVTENKIVLQGAGTAQWLDPHVSYYQFDYWILQNIAETLLWYNGSSATEVIPWLLESFEEVPGSNGTKYECTLRNGIYFQDGNPVNTTAVWFSLNRLLIIDGMNGENTAHSQAAWIVWQLLNTSLSWQWSGPHAYDDAWVRAVLDQNFVEIVDNRTFYLNLFTPSSQLPYILAGQWADIISPWTVIPMEYEYQEWGTWNGNFTEYFVKAAGNGQTSLCVPEEGLSIGSGPYNLTSYDATTHHWVLAKNPNYWGGPPGFAYTIDVTRMIDTVEYEYIESFSTRLLNAKAGTVTGIAVPQDQLYSVINRTAWETNRTAISIIDGYRFLGPYATFVCDWMNFCTNVTDAAGNLLEFQPTADWRIRMAICSSVNLTEMNRDVFYGLVDVANGLLPPNTGPEGAYNASLTVPWSYNLTRAAELIVNAMNNPLTSFTYMNGTKIPDGVIDNSFGPDNPKTVPLHYPAGATSYEKIWTTIATNLNRIATRNNTGLYFTVVPVPIGQLYTLAATGPQVYVYWGGWMADYNHVINWLHPMYHSEGSYFSWNMWNISALDALVEDAIEADLEGNLTRLLADTQAANVLANKIAPYFWLFFETDYFYRSTYLKGWYYCPALGVEYFATMYYET